MATLAIAVIVVCLILCCFVTIPAYTGAIIVNRVSGSLRSVGPGVGILWPWEKIVNGSETPLKTIPCKLDEKESKFQTKDEANISLIVGFNANPIAEHLVEYKRFSEAERLNGIRGKLRSILSIEIRKLADRDTVMDNLEAIIISAQKTYQTSVSEKEILFEHYYGTNIDALTIAFAPLPEELQKAEDEKEAQEKRNEMRKSEMDMIKQMAKELVSESGGTMMYEDAMRRIQVQLGKVKDENKTFGLDKGTQQLIKDAIKGVMTKITAKEAGNGQ